jgi:AbrB family looped-hinge helix DNA binding protein
MPTATVTSKGQITIPIEVRNALGLDAGDKIDFFEIEKGQYAMIPRTGSIMEMRGCVPKLDHTPTIEEMDEALRRHVARLDDETRSDAGLLGRSNGAEPVARKAR